MTLFSGPTDIYSHQVRIVLAEKGVSFEIEHVEKDNPPQDLIDLNPSQSVPTLVDRELTVGIHGGFGRHKIAAKQIRQESQALRTLKTNSITGHGLVHRSSTVNIFSVPASP
jgi:glutaredoxin